MAVFQHVGIYGQGLELGIGYRYPPYRPIGRESIDL